MSGEMLRDATGKNAEERFVAIRAHFLEHIAASGQTRTELYWRPRPGDARVPTEEELVRRWAATFTVSVNDICIGIQRGFMAAADRRQIVTSFLYCEPQIRARVNELRESRVGAFSAELSPRNEVRANPEALKRMRAREEARRVLGGEVGEKE